MFFWCVFFGTMHFIASSGCKWTRSTPMKHDPRGVVPSKQIEQNMFNCHRSTKPHCTSFMFRLGSGGAEHHTSCRCQDRGVFLKNLVKKMGEGEEGVGKVVWLEVCWASPQERLGHHCCNVGISRKSKGDQITDIKPSKDADEWYKWTPASVCSIWALVVNDSQILWSCMCQLNPTASLGWKCVEKSGEQLDLGAVNKHIIMGDLKKEKAAAARKNERWSRL